MTIVVNTMVEETGEHIARLSCVRCGGGNESDLFDERAAQHRCETCGTWMKSPDILDFELNDGDVDRIIILFYED